MKNVMNAIQIKSSYSSYISRHTQVSTVTDRPLKKTSGKSLQQKSLIITAQREHSGLTKLKVVILQLHN